MSYRAAGLAAGHTAPAAVPSEGPLCVDLDGTLLRTDVLWETLWAAIRRRPLLMLLVPFWLMRGRAFLKERAAEHGPICVETLPYNEPLLRYVQEARAAGRAVYLATGCHGPVARRVAAHLGCFDGVIASQDGVNVTGAQKLRILSEFFGSEFEYAGNARADLAVWENCRAAVVVNAAPGVSAAVRKRGIAVALEIEDRPSVWRSLLRQLRVHQWVKNLLVFGALLLSHRLTSAGVLLDGAVAFAAFCLMASAVYVGNDLMDIESDRAHPTKRARPFASGALPLWAGAWLGPVTAIAGLALAAWLSAAFLGAVVLYFAATFYYSWWGKQKPIVDVMLLSGMYSVRLYAGGIACHIEISTWTLAYSSFLFLSLALLKRYSELITVTAPSARRGYEAGDVTILGALGCASGLLAALPLALYAGSPEVLLLYHSPRLLWLLCAVHVYWVSRLWLLANRGMVREDPVLFAVRDSSTYLAALVSAGILALAV
jgi:4-hydroxybenzoate polyprenyltransferase